MAQQGIFRDRDGTINVDHGFVVRLEDWTFFDGADEAIPTLRRFEFAITVVTNQSSIGGGLYSVRDIHAFHKYVLDVLASAYARVDAIAFCPHAPEDNRDCRKPATGMAKQIERQLGTSIAYNRSRLIGDKISDIRFGAALGMQCGIIRRRYWYETKLHFQPQSIGDSLLQVGMSVTGIGESRQ